MTGVLTALLRSVDWEAHSTSVGSAESVPDAVVALVSAGSEEEADDWYWKLDNRVVVQGQLFSAAVPLIPALLVALLGNLEEPVRYRLLELIVQIGAGESHGSESDEHLGQAARSALKEGLWIIYAQMADPSARVRATAVDLVALLETNVRRASEVSQAQLAEDHSEEVQSALARLRQP